MSLFSANTLFKVHTESAHTHTHVHTSHTLTGLTTLQLPEQPTVTASSSFFVAFISLFPSNEAVNQTLSLNGRTLVQYILQVRTQLYKNKLLA